MKRTDRGHGINASTFLKSEHHEGHTDEEHRSCWCKCGFRSGMKEYFYLAKEALEKHFNKRVHYRRRYGGLNWNVESPTERWEF